MRVVCDSDRVDDIEIKKDRTRAREVRAMKQAWEVLEEGRAEKAKESRQKYLQSLAVKQETEENSFDQENDDKKEEVDRINSESSFPSVLGVEFPPFSLVCEENNQSKYYDADQLNEMEMEKREQDLLQDEEKKQSRDEDLAKSLKNCLLIKDQLMTDCNNLQTKTDLYRNQLIKPRAEYRKILLADAKFEQDKKDAAAIENLNLLAESKDSKGAKSPKNGKKKKK